jgi:two-component system phosphate regulon sensor histidine kinase PhoR
VTDLDVAVGALGVLLGAVVTYAALRWGSARGGASAGVLDELPNEPEIDRAVRLLEALPFAAFTVDAGLRVRVFNAAAASLFEVDRGRAVGRAIIEVVPSVELERLLQQAIDGATSARDITFGAGSRARSFGVTAQPYEGGAIAIAADRTAYLAAERVRRDFISDVSHELRTPLSAMKLMLETVLVSDDDAEARALFLPQIAGEVERMIRLVVDLLELARSESGAIAPRRERFDLTDVAMSTVNSFAQRADALGVALDVEAPDNALRHTPAGGSVLVDVRREGSAAVLAVRDTGAGIPFEDLPRIFERFYVVDRSRSRERGGTGLGLAIAKHLVEGHGGTLVAESEYGKGATFTMRIPAPVEP